MRAKFIYESFSETGDPIKDMGIGMEQLILDFFEKAKKNGKLWREPRIQDTEQVLRDLAYLNAPDDFIEYILNRNSNYNKNEILRIFLRNDVSAKFLDDIVKRGAKPENLESKMLYVKKGGTLLSITPEDKLMIACKNGDFDDFKNLVNSGVLLKIGMINSVFKKDWLYTPGAKKQYDKIKAWLSERVDKLEHIVHPKDHKKLEKIKNLLNVNSPKEARDYPQGYRIYRILKFINDNHPQKRLDISKFIYELNYGKGSFTPLLNSSYYSDAFNTIIYPRVEIQPDGTMALNDKGIKDLKKKEEKFKSMKIDPYI